VLRVWDVASGEELVTLTDFQSHTQELWFTDDRIVARNGGYVVIWDAALRSKP
jgi:hypothetical protein